MAELKLTSKDLSYLHENGGYALGLQILEAELDPANIPRSAIVPIDNHLIDQSIFESLEDSFPEGFGVKYSGSHEAFSDYTIRGVNSSRSNFWSPDDDIDMKTFLAGAFLRAPIGTRSLVIQEYIKGDDIIGEVTIEWEEQIRIETSRSLGRALFRYADAELELIEHAGTEIQIDQAKATVEQTLSNAERIMERIGRGFNLEFVGGPNAAFATQLRNIPLSGCRDEELESFLQASRDSASHSSLMSVGRWSGTRNLYVGATDEARVFIKQDDDIANNQVILKSLKHGKPTLVLDPHGGLRLTHRAEDIPKDLCLRRYLAIMSIAGYEHEIYEGDKVVVDIHNQRGVLFHEP